MPDLIRQYVPEVGDGARPVAMMTLILASNLSPYCRPSASVLAAYEADPTVRELRLACAPPWKTPSPR